jgi:hypothetical protein
MSRVIRVMFPVLSAASLVLCVATVVMWVRSYWAADAWDWGTSGFVSANGGLHLWGYSTPDQSNWKFLGFESFYDNRIYSPMRRRTTPYWFLSLLTGVLPAAFLICVLRRRRTAWTMRGRCLSCGYDLRASPERCPECGSAHPGAAVQYNRLPR